MDPRKITKNRYWDVTTFLNITILILLIRSHISTGLDQTREPETGGKDVVDATLGMILQSGIFPDDRNLLRRIACVETNCGTDPDTYPTDYHGGIWQVDETMFDQTKNTQLYQSLTTKFVMISNRFRIEWASVQWNDLRKPLYSALAARLFLSILEPDIPGIADLDGQATYWKTHYDTEIDDGTRERVFKEAVAECEGTVECASPSLDVVFVMDGSGSVRPSNFDLSKDFVADTIDAFDIGEDETRVGVIQYNGSPFSEIELGAISDKDNLKTAVSNIVYRSGGTSTGKAINYMVSNSGYFGGKGRDDPTIPRIGIVITDGRSQDAVLEPADKARDPGRITMFAIGVSGYDISELNEIADDPDDRHRFEVDNFDDIVNIRNVLALTTCLASGALDIDSPFGGFFEPDSVRFLSIPIPEGGMLTFKLQTFSGDACVYLSTLLPNPNSAFYEWKLTSTEENNYMQILIDVSDRIGQRKKRQTEQDLTLYVTITNPGRQRNEVTVTAEPGDTRIPLSCDDNPCQNGGECENRGVDSYICNCPELYSGHKCETDLSLACVSNLAAANLSPTQLSVSWGTSSADCPADDYQLTYKLIDHNLGESCTVSAENEVILSWSADFPRILSDLHPSSTYQITVTPRRSQTFVGRSLSMDQETEMDVPSIAPRNVRLTEATDSSLVISWDELPCKNRNGVIHAYSYQFHQSDNQILLLHSSTTAMFSRQGLKCNTTYTFRVAARTEAGDGPYSDDKFTTDYSPAPFDSHSEVRITITSNNHVELSWKPSDCPASDFTVEYVLVNEDQCLTSGSQQRTEVGVFEGDSAAIYNLVPFSYYTVFVTAKSSTGSLVDRTIGFQTSEDVPAASPANVRSSDVTSTSSTFSWDEVPCGQRRGIAIGYRYELRRFDGDSFIDFTQSRSVTLQYLLQNREYSFKVAAVTGVGVGEFSAEVKVTTIPAKTYDCTDTTCPFGYRREADGQCEVARVIYFPLTITKIDGRPAVITFQLLDTTSQEYLELACRVKTVLKSILDEEIEILGSAGGSIVLNVAVLLDEDSTTTALDIVTRLNAELGIDGNIGNDLIVEGVSNIQDFCPVGFCANGGTCMSTSATTPSYCICLNGFEGDRCEEGEQTGSTGGSDNNPGTAVIITVLGLVFVLAVLGLFWCLLCYRRRRMASTPLTYSNQVSSGIPIRLGYFVDPYTNQSPWTFGPVNITRLLPNYGGIHSLQQSTGQPWQKNNYYF